MATGVNNSCDDKWSEANANNIVISLVAYVVYTYMTSIQLPK